MKKKVLLTRRLCLDHIPSPWKDTSLYSSRGVIRTDTLDGILDEGIQFAVADQLVLREYRLNGMRDSKVSLCVPSF
jgi:hypothetical protein